MAIPPDEFTLFPELPPELRRAIWRECLPRRVIDGLSQRSRDPIVLQHEKSISDELPCPSNL